MQPRPDVKSWVAQLRQQGYANEQILQYLQQQGMSSNEVLDALNQPKAEQPQEHTEEVVEAIINEKWQEVVKDMNKLVEWKEQAENRLARIEQDVKNVRENFQSLHHGVLGKVQQYDQNIQNVGAEIKAMEKVFQDILPKFTENVNKLARIAKRN